jgi:hypothetical protein
LTGEYRNCSTFEKGNTYLECGVNEVQPQVHAFSVRFHGRLDRTDYPYHTWRCQRNNIGFLESHALTCWALD